MRRTTTTSWGPTLLKRVLTFGCIPLLAWSLSPWGHHSEAIPTAWATVTSTIQMPSQVTDTIETIGRIRDGVQDAGTIEDRMVEQVAEQCAIIIAGGLDDECTIRLATAAEEMAESRQLREAMTP